MVKEMICKDDYGFDTPCKDNSIHLGLGFYLSLALIGLVVIWYLIILFTTPTNEELKK